MFPIVHHFVDLKKIENFENFPPKLCFFVVAPTQTQCSPKFFWLIQILLIIGPFLSPEAQSGHFWWSKHVFSVFHPISAGFSPYQPLKEILRKYYEKMRKNEKFLNFRKLHQFLNYCKKLVKIGRIAEFLSTNSKKSRKKVSNRRAEKNQVSQKPLKVVLRQARYC